MKTPEIPHEVWIQRILLHPAVCEGEWFRSWQLEQLGTKEAVYYHMRKMWESQILECKKGKEHNGNKWVAVKLYRAPVRTVKFHDPDAPKYLPMRKHTNEELGIKDYPYGVSICP